MDYFPEEDVKKTKKFMSILWKLENCRKAGYQINDGAYARDSANRRVYPKATVKEQWQDPQKMLEHQLDDFKIRSKYKDDFIPVLSPSFGGGRIFASAFGCPMRWSSENEDPWVEPIVINPEDVYNISSPEVTDGLLGKVLEYTKFFREETGGAYPIGAGVRSPLDIASQIWKYENFLRAMYTDPEEVHLLLDKITKLLISFLKAQRDIAGEFVPNSMAGWAPSNWGLSLSEDLLAIVPPDLYEKFALPYNERISEEFNGISLHSCGNFEFNFDNLSKYKNLKGLDFGVTETPLVKVMGKFSGKTLIIPHLGANIDIHFETVLDYVKYVLEKKNKQTCLYLMVDRYIYKPKLGEYEEADLGKIYNFLSTTQI